MARLTVSERRTRTFVTGCVASFGIGVGGTLYVDGTLTAVVHMILSYWSVLVFATAGAALCYYVGAAVIRAFLVTLAQYLDTCDNPNVEWRIW